MCFMLCLHFYLSLSLARYRSLSLTRIKFLCVRSVSLSFCVSLSHSHSLLALSYTLSLGVGLLCSFMLHTHAQPNTHTPQTLIPVILCCLASSLSLTSPYTCSCSYIYLCFGES